MKKIVMILMIAFAATAAAFGQTNKNEQAVRQTVNDLTAALAKNDAAALERIYADDYIFVGDDGTMMTKKERIAAFRSGELKYESINSEVLGIRFYKDTAVAMTRFTTKFAPGGKFNGGRAVATLTFVKMKGGWQLVAAHNTRLGEQ